MDDLALRRPMYAIRGNGVYDLEATSDSNGCDLRLGLNTL